MQINIVLVHPDIPQNTGNIARLTAANRAKLHLIHPMGFKIDEKQVKRAGLDYWPMVELAEYDDWSHFLSANEQPQNLWFFSTKAKRDYYEVAFTEGKREEVYLVYGSETAGLPSSYIETYPERFLKIPMAQPGVRSLNLANSVAIGLYEVIRQQAADSVE
ncbi:UNVERIFIED_CONTAM: hypothetical protein GTU68_002551 [Idotea baltica]|nr:hypothetical protein [Idotea baltica]